VGKKLEVIYYFDKLKEGKMQYIRRPTGNPVDQRHTRT
jgi:hypothetical protein